MTSRRWLAVSVLVSVRPSLKVPVRSTLMHPSITISWVMQTTRRRLAASPVISALTSAELGFPTVLALSSTRRRTSISTVRLNARTVRNIRKTTVIRSA